MAKKHRHYCKVCREYKSNESFSGSGHAAHICKKCAALPAAQRSEKMVLAKLWNLPWQLSTQQREWLRGLRNDSRPEVASAAKELYANRFPYTARNERKKQLHILHMEFTICGEVIDEYGDVCCESLCFTLDRKEHTVTLHRENRTMQITLTEKDMRKLLNVIVNNYEVFPPLPTQTICGKTSGRLNLRMRRRLLKNQRMRIFHRGRYRCVTRTVKHRKCAGTTTFRIV